MRINLGCGQNKLLDYINVDKFDSFGPDVVHDLEIFPWPFDNDVASEIVLHHSLEHMGAEVDVFLKIMQELYRISKPDCVIKIAVPHPRSDGFEGDPSHVRKITPQILSLFSLSKNKEWAQLGWPNTPFATYLRVDFELIKAVQFLTPHWLNEFQRGAKTEEEINFAASTYFNVVDQLHIDLRGKKPFSG